MKDVMGIIYTTKDDFALRELTASRAVAALPVVGRYRIIDFMLSSMVNSDIKNVGVIMQKNYHSLMDHIGAGKEWDLHTKNDGLFILPPFQTRENQGTYQGTVDALRSNISYVKRSNQEYVILCSTYSVFNTTFDNVLDEHVASGADVTMLYTKYPIEDRSSSSNTAQHCYLDLDEEGAVRNIEMGAEHHELENFSMNVFLMKRELLVLLVEQAHAKGIYSIHQAIKAGFLDRGNYLVRGHEYTGYHKRVESIPSYYAFNMDMLDEATRKDLFASPVFTKVRDEVPARYAKGAVAINSLLADGCVIEGCVENSVLFRGVRVRKGAVVRNSIIMQESDIRENVEVEHVIFDKGVTIREGRLIGQKGYPIVIKKNCTL